MEWIDFAIGFTSGAVFMFVCFVAWSYDAMVVHDE